VTRPVLTIVSLIVLTVVMTACGGETADTTAGASEAAEPSGDRLAQVQERDSLICGVNDGLPGFGFLDENGENVGFDVDFCRAIAAAVLGDPTKVEFRALDADGRQPAIQSGEIDVLLRNVRGRVRFRASLDDVLRRLGLQRRADAPTTPPPP
jgi:general L-amino acid transport system substrate-binding protein